MTDSDADRPTAPSTRRNVMKTLGAVAVGSSFATGATARDSERRATNRRRFEIRAADDVEFEYHFKAAGPVEGVTDPERGPGAEPGGNDSIQQLSDGHFHVSGTTGFGENDIWRLRVLKGFWTDVSPDEYTLRMDGDEFSWASYDDTPSDFIPFEVRAAPHAETFHYEFTALTNWLNVNNPSEVAAELFGNDVAVERETGYRIRGATGRGESDTWMLGYGPLEPDVVVTDFSADAPADEYTLLYGDDEISPEQLS